jgi:nitrite reductase/ring-hydroxylating ferredoxin subunit
VAAAACFTGSLLGRWRGKRASGVTLSLLGAGVMTLGAYLGGHLSFRKGVGVDETTFDEGPAEWTDAIAVEEVPEGKPVTASVGGITLLLYRSGDSLAAIDNRCSHRGGPLNEGTCDGDTVTCPWHASVFRLSDGGIVRGPAVAKQPSYDVRINGDRIEVRRNPGELHA